MTSGGMGPPPTPDDFERLSWQDCHIWRIEFRTGDPAENDWTSDLILGIDYIVDWTRGTDQQRTFRIAPALLVFHDVTAPRVGVDWGANGESAPVHDAVIHTIERALDEEAGLAVPYYRWLIRLTLPPGGELSFRATGFTQTLLCEPVHSTLRSLSTRRRSSLLEL
jgi:hypothetical protein